MNETKTAFDMMIETQSKIVDSLVESSKKITETFKMPEQATESIEKSRAFVNEWLEKQQNTLETSVESLKKQVKFESAPEVLKEALASQQELGKEWFEALRATVKAKDLKELNEILTANVKKLQDNMKEVVSFWTESFSKPMNVSEIFTAEFAKDMNKKMVEMLKPAKV
ncbi:MAG: hypothetical protein OHK0053_31480 [Microscillaceae bacterium]